MAIYGISGYDRDVRREHFYAVGGLDWCDTHSDYVDWLVLEQYPGSRTPSETGEVGKVTRRRTLDISQLPTVVFEARSIMSWAMFGMMLIEGTMFCIVLATYFYLRTRSTDWPAGTNPPGLFYGSINTGIFVVSLI